MIKSMLPKARVSMEKLAIVYRADRGLENIEAMETIEQEVLDKIPSSDGLGFADFLALCQNTIDVYEEDGE